MQLTAFALALSCALASSVSAQVVNGGFEEPNTGFRTVNSGQTFGNWTNQGPGNIEFVQAVPNGALPNLQFSAFEGQYWIDLVGTQSPSAISQAITGLNPGGQYRISWAQAGNVWGGNFAFTMQVLWNGNVVAENTQTHGGSNGQLMNWQERFVDVTANLTGGPNQLTFRATTGANSRGPALDAVSIAPIPAPGSVALLAVAGLAAARRRRAV
jgi:MYXO-CTERM domain-containing protein